MKRYLNKQEIEELALQTRYSYKGSENTSRCSDGDYENVQNLPALALPGGDLGQLVILYTAAKVYGLELNLEKALEQLLIIIGGQKLFSFSNICAHSADICQYLHYLVLQPNKYNLLREEVEFVIDTLKSQNIIVNTAISHVSENIQYNACILYEGNEGILPFYTFNKYNETFHSRVFVVHKTFIDKRNKLICEILLDNKAVKLYDGLDTDYLYEVISEITDEQIFETLNLIDPQIPIFEVSQDSDTKISVNLLS